VEKSGATVCAHSLDQEHIAGEYDYSDCGIGFICGVLELAGRSLFRYQAPVVDHWFEDNEELAMWGGIRVQHLPGHTMGHCGFYSNKYDLLFAGDLYATSWLKTVSPWPWLNACPHLFKNSFQRVLELNPQGILANHCDQADAQTQGKRFKNAFGRCCGGLGVKKTGRNTHQNK